MNKSEVNIFLNIESAQRYLSYTEKHYQVLRVGRLEGSLLSEVLLSSNAVSFYKQEKLYFSNLSLFGAYVVLKYSYYFGKGIYEIFKF